MIEIATFPHEIVYAASIFQGMDFCVMIYRGIFFVIFPSSGFRRTRTLFTHNCFYFGYAFIVIHLNIIWNAQLLARKYMDENEHDRLSSCTLGHKLKQNTGTAPLLLFYISVTQ